MFLQCNSKKNQSFKEEKLPRRTTNVQRTCSEAHEINCGETVFRMHLTFTVPEGNICVFKVYFFS